MRAPTLSAIISSRPRSILSEAIAKMEVRDAADRCILARLWPKDSTVEDAWEKRNVLSPDN